MPFPVALTRWSVALQVSGVQAFIPQMVNGFVFSQMLNKPDTVQFQVPGDHNILNFLVENSTDILVWRGATLRFRGRLLSLDDTVDDQDHYTVQCTAADYSQLLQTRMVPEPGLSYNLVDQAQIVWQLIQATQAQTSGNLGITAGTLTGGGINRIRNWLPGPPYIGKLIDDMHDNLNGFDWWIDELLRLQVRSPRRVRNLSNNLTYPKGNIKAFSRGSTAAQFRNVIRETGEPVTTPVYATALPDTRGRFELSEGNPGMVDQSALAERAPGVLAQRQNPRATYIITLQDGVYGTQFTSDLGDLMNVQIRRGRLNVNALHRIMEQRFTIGNNGSERVQMAVLAE